MAESPQDLVIETYKLTKIYQNRQIAINDVTLRIEPGCVLGLLGPNGFCAWSLGCTGPRPAG